MGRQGAAGWRFEGSSGAIRFTRAVTIRYHEVTGRTCVRAHVKPVLAAPADAVRKMSMI
jgi:hypothetical protein